MSCKHLLLPLYVKSTVKDQEMIELWYLSCFAIPIINRADAHCSEPRNGFKVKMQPDLNRFRFHPQEARIFTTFVTRTSRWIRRDFPIFINVRAAHTVNVCQLLGQYFINKVE